MTTPNCSFSEALIADAKGAAILLVIGLLLLLLVAGALVIDLSRGQYSRHVLQMVTDSASLAGAVELTYSSNNSLDRWRNSKRAVIASLSQNIARLGVLFPSPTDNANHRGNADSCEVLGNYRSQIFDDGISRIEIIRGHYDKTPPGTFTSLEDDTNCQAGIPPLPNAIQVTVRVDKFRGIFAPIVFGSRLPPIVSSSMSTLEH